MPTIFVPGIKGSELADTYPVNFPVRWSLEDVIIGDIVEDEEDLLLRDGMYDRDLHLFREWRPIRLAYSRLVRRLREHDPHSYIFPYDWRRALESSARKLVDFTQHIFGKHRQSGEQAGISFVTHSMGGLVLRSALGLLTGMRVSRIVFIAPPFRGSADIPKVLIAGEKDGWFGDEEGYRKLARSFPSVYQLVPSFANALVDSPSGQALDPFALKNWQQNVTAPKSGFRHDFLRNAEKFVRGDLALLGGHSSAPVVTDEKLAEQFGSVALVLLGTGHETVYKIPVITNNPRNRNWFDFSVVEHDQLGDGRVHLRSAAIEGITLAAFDTKKDHGKVCRDDGIITATTDWLKAGRVLKRKPRTPRNSIARPGREYFSKWDGEEKSFALHRITRTG